MKLVIFPDDKLRKPSEPIGALNVETKSELWEMHSTMLIHNGVGLAAPQVGIHKRMFVVDIHDGKGPTFFVNPVVREIRAGLCPMTEGCLSVPGTWGTVVRPSHISVTFLDIQGKKQEKLCDGLLARVIQHEADHLDGIMHFDRMEPHHRRSAMDEIHQNRVRSYR